MIPARHRLAAGKAVCHMDNETRFWIAQEVANSKHDARSLLKMGKEVAGKRPLAFVTYGLPA